MPFKMGQSFTQIPAKKMFMSHLMKNALMILQMPQEALEEWLIDQIEENPFLERSPSKQNRDSIPLNLSKKPSLYEHLSSQVDQNFQKKKEREVALYIIGSLDERGYFSENIVKSSKSLNISEKDFLAVLYKVQHFDPVGIAAMNLQNCLMIQMRDKKAEKTLSYQILKEDFENLLRHKFSILAKKHSTSKEEIQKDLQRHVKPLYIHPASSFEIEIPRYVKPDIEIDESGNILIDRDIPEFIHSQKYANYDFSRSEKRMIEKWVHRGHLLKNQLNHRKKILMEITKILLKKQKQFFLSSFSIAPLTIKDAAKELSIHESTLRRSIQDKYILTEKGLFPLSFFFSPECKKKGESKKGLLETLEKIVKGENKKRPLSDEEIVGKLQEKGYPIARRTVTKYRNKLNIASQKMRKISQ